MSSSDSPTRRREFLGQIAASAVVLAGTACASPAAVAATSPSPNATPPQPAPPAPAVPVHWDDTWFTRLTAKHKAVFDSPQIEDGLVLANATGYIRGFRDAVAAGPDDVQAVVVVRHGAIPMAFNDAMWEKYEIGKEEKVKDFRTDKWAVRNPFLGPPPPAAGAPARPAPPSDRPQSNFMWLAAHGHILLGCDLATRGFAGVVAQKAKADSRAVYEEFKANLVPGMILQPTGVYAALRAQEAGCTYIRST